MSSFNIKRLNKPFDVVIENIASDKSISHRCAMFSLFSNKTSYINVLDCGNSGTAMRLFCGLLASVDGSFVLSGDKYLRSRPMKRVADPLRNIGANIDGRENGNKAPLFIRVFKTFYLHLSS